MKKYIAKPTIIEAEIYKRGMEDGYCLPGEVRNNLVHKEYGSTGFCAYMWTREGKRFIAHGDYIVKDENGEKYIVDHDKFKKYFDKVEEGDEGKEKAFEAMAEDISKMAQIFTDAYWKLKIGETVTLGVRSTDREFVIERKK